MNRLYAVIGREFRETVRSAQFVTLSVILALGLILCTAFLSSAGKTSQGGTLSYKVALSSENTELAEKLKSELPYVTFVDITPEREPEELLDGGYDAVLYIYDGYHYTCCEKSSVLFGNSNVYDTLSSSLVYLTKSELLAELGIDQDDVRALLSDTSYPVGQRVFYGGVGRGRAVLTAAIMLLMFLGVELYGQTVASGVSSEKGGRVMEVLSSSASPRTLLCGKVLGIGSACFLQLMTFFALLLVILSAFAKNTAFGEALPSFGGAVIFSLYFIGGFAFMAFLYGAAGSAVSGTQELSGLSVAVMLLFSVGFFASASALVTGRSDAFLKICSYIPLWSPSAMLARTALGRVSPIEIIISLGVLFGSTVLCARFSSWLYGRMAFESRPFLEMIKPERKNKK